MVERWLVRAVTVLGAATVALSGLTGCGTDAPSRSELVEALERSGIDRARAECAADAVLDTLTEEQVVDLVERGPAGAPRDDPERENDASDRVRAALAECRELGTTTTTSTAPDEGTADDGTADSGAADGGTAGAEGPTTTG